MGRDTFPLSRRARARGRGGLPRKGVASLSSVALVAGLWAPPTRAVPQAEPVTVNIYDVQGLSDMPTALAPPDGEPTTHFAYFGGTARGALGFQILPRI